MLKIPYPVFLEYPPSSANEPRWGYGKPSHPILHEYLARQQDNYAGLLQKFLIYGEQFASLAGLKINGSGQETLLKNNWIPGLDAFALYGMLALNKPEIYLEAGSGVSTSITHQAIRNHNTGTQIISIDPRPRKHIDRICDEIIRKPVENLDMAVFDQLSAGDILFIDSSHRCFMNSDVTVIFMDVLPRLKSGVLVHFHDIFLPDDYPPGWRKRYYSEQYLLGAYLLSNGSLFDVLLPNAFITKEPALFRIIEPVFNKPEMQDVPRGGGSFWIKIR